MRKAILVLIGVLGVAKTAPYNPLRFVLPYLQAGLDANASAQAEIFTASMPSGLDAAGNLAKVPFYEEAKKHHFALSYLPWQREIIADAYLLNVSTAHKLHKSWALTTGLDFFSSGKIMYSDLQGNSLGMGFPKDIALQVGGVFKATPNFALGLKVKYLYSSIAHFDQGVQTRQAQGFATDLAVYYQKEFTVLYGFSLGVVVQNIGTTMRYTGSPQKHFLPASLNIGTGHIFALHADHKLVLLGEASKMLVPTPARYAWEIKAPQTLVSGYDANISPLQAIFQSFYDAPGTVFFDSQTQTYRVEKGSRFWEEMREITWKTAVQYRYKDMFSFSVGYIYQDPSKAFKNHITYGLGASYKMFTLHFAHALALSRNTPISNALKMALVVGI
jgi:hypothetical protein